MSILFDSLASLMPAVNDTSIQACVRSNKLSKYRLEGTLWLSYLDVIIVLI